MAEATSIRRTSTYASLLTGIATVLILPVVQNSAWAISEVIPGISIQEKYVESNTSALDETGTITVVNPSIVLTYSQARLDLFLNYGIDAIFYNSLQTDDKVNQKLDFVTSFTHQPGHWTSLIRANIEQANISTEGVQLLDDSLQSDNLRERTTLGFSTAYQNRIFNDLELETNLDLNYVETENESSANNHGVIARLGSSKVYKFSWTGSIRTQETSQNELDETVNTLDFGLNYRLNQKYSTFLTVSKSDTSNSQINEADTTVGIIWKPTKQSYFQLGIGKRGSEQTYTLDSVINKKYLTLSMNYSEQVTTSIQQLFSIDTDQQTLSSSSVTQSIDPILLKRGSVTLALTGRRSTLSIAYFNQIENRGGLANIDETTQGININLTRVLSPFSSLYFDASHQESQLSEDNTVEDFTLGYERRLGKIVSFLAELRETQQSSTVVENEYKNRSFSLSFVASF